MSSKLQESNENIGNEVNKGKSELFFERFKTLLATNGLTQSQLAEKVGVYKQYIWSIAHLRQIPPLYLKVKIAKALNTDSSVIWRKEDEEGCS